MKGEVIAVIDSGDLEDNKKEIVIKPLTVYGGDLKV